MMMEGIRWFHRIDLGDGVITPGLDDSPRKLARLEMPTNLRGKSVLDIGAWDGFFSFEAERRRAARVLAVDSWIWAGNVAGWSRAGFDYARTALCSQVEDVLIEVEDLNPDEIGVFDLVLFLGVLYHLRHPLLALEKVSSVTKDLLILETHVNRISDPDPVMVFYPDWIKSHGGMPWGPNPHAVLGMLKAVGFAEVEQKGIYPLRPDADYGRMVVHARKGEG